ncbi:hypothetical protein [Arenimonas fontis]|uniref:Cobalamin ABC transporter n=1 Tax=Arenimonas fontis TaxID=2608255 RepID=A0A5B2Z967_9GAMM|nr:hypothetical protein [Arenimonas fontis]KAA2283702.1 hypothetical protein F0415_12140 [Arenimonas fontis]
MIQSLRSRLALFALLAAVLAATRLNHFGAVPDASWAVFLLSGFYLRRDLRWAFPLLMALSVLVDFLVIRASGLDFWSHYCVSPGYWFLVPAYLSLWLAGAWLARGYTGLRPRELARAALALVAGVTACHLLAQGGFYWLSPVVAEPTLAGWWKNFSDWFLPYLGSTGLYVGLAAVLHVTASLAHGLWLGAARAPR